MVSKHISQYWRQAYDSATSLNLLIVERTVAAEGVPKVYAPPA